MKHDIDMLMESQSTKETKATVSNVIRIETQVEQNQPIQVNSSTLPELRDVMGASKKLQNSDLFREVFVSKDMTPLERSQWKALVKERKEKQAHSIAAGEETRWIIRNNKVIK